MSGQNCSPLLFDIGVLVIRAMRPHRDNQQRERF
jgi:hypothetical protein